MAHVARFIAFVAFAALLEVPPVLAQPSGPSGAAPAAPLAQQADGVAETNLGLDFDAYRARVEPILLSPRAGNARCVVCHSRGGGNSFLEPLSAGSTTYTEEQSFRNFERIQRLVVAGAPLESALLVNPLAEDAGGSHWHAGGKHWTSQSDQEWQVLAEWVRATRIALDFRLYRTRVEPILVSPRSGNARCVVCHSRGGGNSFLEPLSVGSTTYSEEQSFRNFERIQRLVVPGAPLESVLLVNPLAEDAGGSHWHAGGKHWTSQSDQEWQALAMWVRGQSSR